MNIQKAKRLIPDYLDDVLQSNDLQAFRELLKVSSELQKEVEAYRKAWALLSDAPEIEPAPGYVSQFWTRISKEESSPARAINPWKVWIRGWQVKPVLAAACVALLVGIVSVRGYIQRQSEQEMLSRVNEQDIEMIENMEIVQNLEIIEDLDFYENMDVIEYVDPSESWNIHKLNIDFNVV